MASAHEKVADDRDSSPSDGQLRQQTPSALSQTQTQAQEPAEQKNQKPRRRSATTTATATATASTPSNKKGKQMNPLFRPAGDRGGRLPPILDHFNYRDMTTLIKSSLAIWIYTLFIWIGPTERMLGQASFFGVILLTALPASGVVFVSVIGNATLALGICSAWAWGTITMKAALATRPAADLQRQLAALQQQLAAQGNTTNPEQASGQTSYAQIAIYNGALLDTRVTITYFCMIGLFIYLLARLRVFNPKFTFFSIFGMIIANIYLVIAPLIPTFSGTLPQILIKPGAIAIGLGILCNLTLFPQTTTSITIEGMDKILKPMNPFLAAANTCFEQPTIEMELSRLRQTKMAIIGAWRALQPGLGFLNLDVYRGRWHAGDIKNLQGPLRQVTIACLSFMDLHIFRGERHERLAKLSNVINGSETPGTVLKPAGHGHAVAVFNIKERLRQPNGETIFEAAMKALSTSCTPLLESCEETLTAISAALANENRSWFKRVPEAQHQQRREHQVKVLDRLQTNIAEVSGRVADRLWDESHEHHLEAFTNSSSENSPDPHHTSLNYSGVTSLVIQERVLNYAIALEAFLSAISQLEKQRQRTHVRFPFGFSKFSKWGLKCDNDPNLLGGESAEADQGLEKITPDDSSSEQLSVDRKPKTQDADAQAPIETMSAVKQLELINTTGSRRRTKGGHILIAVLRWIGSTEGTFALRVTVATLGIGVIGVTKETAGFFYREKGLWALIMAQMVLVPYTADFVLGLILRAGGTVIGAVAGMVAWYIGAGNGPGSPYGMAAIVAPVIIVVMWIRLFSSPVFLQGCIMLSATFFLVVGYSWSDTHIPSYGNPGVGYSVMWRRLLLVLIGFAASVIVMLFPKPPSARRHQRRLLSESLDAVRTQYALFANNCRAPPDDLVKVGEGTLIKTLQLLAVLEPQIRTSRLEFSTCNIDAATMSAVCVLIRDSTQYATQLLLYASQLPPLLKERFVTTTGCLDERTVTDVMSVLSLVAQALKSGDPLPAIMPIVSQRLVGRTVHGSDDVAAAMPSVSLDAEREAEVGLEEAKDAGASRSSDEGEYEKGGTKPHHAPLTREMLQEEGIRKYCCAMVAFAQLLGVLDELTLVMKRAVGESSRMDPSLFC